jgi:hypothetical protein
MELNLIQIPNFKNDTRGGAVFFGEIKTAAEMPAAINLPHFRQSGNEEWIN